jgi:hypothetical protein
MAVPVYDVAIAYRIYPSVSKQPLVFGSDKYNLARCALRSFAASLHGVRAKIFALLDGCPDEYETLFRAVFDADDLVVYRLNNLGNGATFSLQIKILLEQTASENVYLAEDDYFYLPNTFQEMLEFLAQHSTRTIITPFDHLDYYTHALHTTYRSAITYSQHRHWRTVSSTCLTFLTTKTTLRDMEPLLRTFERGNWDAAIFAALTKLGITRPDALWLYGKEYLRGRNNPLFVFIKAWLHGWQQILFGSRFTVWSPLPAVGTHLQFDTLSPTIDWDKAVKRLTTEISAQSAQ